MILGYVGLGKMGQNMIRKLHAQGYRLEVFDANPKNTEKVSRFVKFKARSLKDLILHLPTPRLIWIMVPHQAVEKVLSEIQLYLKPGDTIIDGGNSPYWLSIARYKQLKKRKIDFLDVGVSGGPAGAQNGASIMVGGERKVFKKYQPLLKSLAVKNGCAYLGDAGAGHFVKMIHNGIEYGMMQSLAEGFAVMKKSNFKLKLKEVAKIYNHGSVIESRLVGWLEKALRENGENLNSISGSVAQSGEGLWTVQTAKKLRVATPVIAESIRFRAQSKANPSYTGQIVSALRNQFGGHNVTKK